MAIKDDEAAAAAATPIELERAPTRRMDPGELRKLVVSLVVVVDHENDATPFEGVPAVKHKTDEDAPAPRAAALDDDRL